MTGPYNEKSQGSPRRLSFFFFKILLVCFTFSISPGAVLTPMYKSWAATQGQYADLDAVLKEASTYNVSSNSCWYLSFETIVYIY